MDIKFEKWLNDESNYSSIVKDKSLDFFYELLWEFQWVFYQKYFWETKRWWVSIYPYTDKFGGKIESFWGDVHLNIHFITNNPEHAQKKLIEKAFELNNK
jgi:hypothetical protein